MSQILKKGSKGEEVTALQQSLQNLGFSLVADGHFGDITHNTIIALQIIFGYDVDGMVGPATHKLIQTQLGYRWNLELARKGGYPQQSGTASA